jgi:hypothetical protein
MPWVMHRFAEALAMTERGQLFSAAEAACPVEPNPCARELEQSQTPFGADYGDFSVLDIKEQHLMLKLSERECVVTCRNFSN